MDVVSEAVAIAREHPVRRAAGRAHVLGAVLLVTALFVGPGAPPVAALLFAVAAWSGWRGLEARRTASHLTLVNLSHDRFRRGHLAEAAALLDACEAMRPPRYVRRAVAIHRALHALERGALDVAEQQATLAIDAPLGLFTRTWEQLQVHRAHALRGLVRASRRDPQAEHDIARARESAFAFPLTLAHAEIADAVLGANADDKARVRRALAEAAPYLDDLDGRAHALVQALARYARDERRSVYRHAAKPDEREPAVDTWIAAMAPSAAAYARMRGEGARATDLDEADEPSASAVRARRMALQASKPALPSRPVATMTLWLVLVVFVVGTWQLLTPSQTRHGEAGYDAEIFLGALAVLVAGLFAAMVVGNARVATKRYMAIRAHSLGLLRGDPHARKWLEGIAHAGSPDAALEVARAYERAADFERAIAWCDAGLRAAQATVASRASSWDMAAPGLSAERAFCLAAAGRADEANAELAAMPNARGYAYRATALFRVKLAQALVRGDRPLALSLARSRGEVLTLPSRDALVLDLLEATDASRERDAEEWARLQRVLAEDPVTRAWVSHFLPETPNHTRVRIAEPEEEEEEEEAQSPARAYVPERA